MQRRRVRHVAGSPTRHIADEAVKRVTSERRGQMRKSVRERMAELTPTTMLRP